MEIIKTREKEKQRKIIKTELDREKQNKIEKNRRISKNAEEDKKQKR